MSKTPDNAFVIDLMQHELERLKFMLKSYFRTRNSKVILRNITKDRKIHFLHYPKRLE